MNITTKHTKHTKRLAKKAPQAKSRFTFASGKMVVDALRGPFFWLSW